MRTIRDVSFRDGSFSLIAAECLPCFCICFEYVVQWNLTCLIFDAAGDRDREL